MRGNEILWLFFLPFFQFQKLKLSVLLINLIRFILQKNLFAWVQAFCSLLYFYIQIMYQLRRVGKITKCHWEDFLFFGFSYQLWKDKKNKNKMQDHEKGLKHIWTSDHLYLSGPTVGHQTQAITRIISQFRRAQFRASDLRGTKALISLSCYA